MKRSSRNHRPRFMRVRRAAIRVPYNDSTSIPGINYCASIKTASFVGRNAKSSLAPPLLTKTSNFATTERTRSGTSSSVLSSSAAYERLLPVRTCSHKGSIGRYRTQESVRHVLGLKCPGSPVERRAPES